jgi:hypothetical protein
MVQVFESFERHFQGDFTTFAYTMHTDEPHTACIEGSRFAVAICSIMVAIQALSGFDLHFDEAGVKALTPPEHFIVEAFQDHP